MSGGNKFYDFPQIQLIKYGRQCRLHLKRNWVSW